MSVGKLVNHLWETAETQGIYVTQLNDANKTQDLRITALENQKSAQGADLVESNLVVNSNSGLSATNSNTNINEDVKPSQNVEARGIEPPDSGLTNPSGPPGPAPASAETYQEEKNNANSSVWSDFKDGLVSILNKITFTAQATFEKTVAFLGDVTFGGKAKFEDAVIFNQDTAGHAKIKKGDKKVAVKFDKDFGTVPVVTATASGQALIFQVTDESKSGFAIQLAEDAKDDVSFNWMAIQTSGTRTAESKEEQNSNPLPQLNIQVNDSNINSNTNNSDTPTNLENTNENAGVQQESNANTNQADANQTGQNANSNNELNLTSDNAAEAPQTN